MTGICALVLGNSCLICMDTMAICAVTKEPVKFESKIHPILEMGLIFCGTGTLDTIKAWKKYLITNVQTTSIDDFEIEVPRTIGRFVEQFGSGIKVLSQYDCTLYHFGYSIKDDAMKIFKIELRNGLYNFERVCSPYMFKPPDVFDEIDVYRYFTKKISGGSMDIDDAIGIVVNAMISMKVHDDLQPIEDKVGIGGEIEILYYVKNEVLCRHKHELPDLNMSIENLEDFWESDKE